MSLRRWLRETSAIVVRMDRRHTLLTRLAIWRAAYWKARRRREAAETVWARRRRRALHEVLRKWRAFLQRRESARRIQLALLRPLCARFLKRGMKSFLGNWVAEGSAIEIQRVVLGFLARRRARKLKRYKEHEAAILLLAAKYRRQRLLRRVLRRWRATVRRLVERSADLAYRATLRRRWVRWVAKASRSRALLRLAAVLWSVALIAPIRRRWVRWRAETRVRRRIEQATYLADRYSVDKELSRALTRWEDFR